MLNVLNCANVFENTGAGKCSFIPREVIGMLFVPSTLVIDKTDAEDLQAFLEAATRNPVKAARVRPLQNIVGVTDNSEEPVRETLGYGSTQTLRDGNYAWTFRFVRGGLCLLKSLQAMNGQPVDVIFIDGALNLFGTKKTVGSKTGLGGVPIEDFWANKWGASDGAGASVNMSVYLSFKSVYINENLVFLQTKNLENVDLLSLQGLQDIDLDISDASPDGIEYSLVDKCTGNDTDFSSVFVDELEQVTSLSIVNLSSGTPYEPDSITYNASTKRFAASFESNIPAGNYLVNLAPVDVLEGLGIIGYEGRPVKVTIS
jgi:hypothetical protein